MVHIKEFTVQEPPTSGEVRTQALQALEARALFPLTILSKQMMPPAQPEEVSVRIQQVTEFDTGETRIRGRTAAKAIISVMINADDAQPATGDIIVE